MCDDEQKLRSHESRKRFDTLLVDPAHARSDCRLIRRALRLGWVQGEDAIDLIEDFHSKAKLGPDRPPLTQPVRSGLAACEVFAEIGRMTLNEVFRTMPCYSPRGGRPRKRPIANGSDRISAKALRLLVLEPSYVRTNFCLRWQTLAGDKCEQNLISLWVPTSAVDWKLWLLCPRCQRRRAFMYLDAAGLGCRVCTRARYVPRKRG